MPRQTSLGGEQSNPHIQKVNLSVMTPKMIERYSKYVVEMNRRARRRAVCPWCLYMGTLDKFSKMTMKYELAKNVECPWCKNGMRVKTTQIFDRKDDDYSWPRWFWEQVFMWEGYEKVRWEDVKERMKPFPSLRQIYWEVYHDFKNDKHGASDEYRDLDVSKLKFRPLGDYGEKQDEKP